MWDVFSVDRFKVQSDSDSVGVVPVLCLRKSSPGQRPCRSGSCGCVLGASGARNLVGWSSQSSRGKSSLRVLGFTRRKRWMLREKRVTLDFR